MLVYTSRSVRLFLPLINKTCKNKTAFSLWRSNIHKNKAILNGSYSYAKACNLQTQIQHFHTTRKLNEIVSFNLSDIGEGIREVVVKEWYVKVGDKVAQFDNICEVQSDKASVTITSRYDGVITKLHHAIDDIALVGKPLFDIDSLSATSEDEIKSEPKEVKTEVPTPKIEAIKEIENLKTESTFHGFAIPSVRRLAKENKIKVTDVKGTGKDGRVLKEDILKYLQNKSSPLESQDDMKIEPIRGYTRAMIKTMSEAMKIPHFVYHDEIRVTNLVKLREKIKLKSTETNLKITYMPFFIKATSNALLRFPIINARLDEKHENIIYYNSHNIGVAMDTPSGLAVPVIKNVQNKNITEINNELKRLQELGKQSKFSKDDLSDGTISFSNIGAIGGTYAKPVILPPQSAIIALGAFQTLPRFGDDDTITREVITYFSGAGDHRIIDGATMARFCNVLKNQIENPEFLFLNL